MKCEHYQDCGVPGDYRCEDRNAFNGVRTKIQEGDLRGYCFKEYKLSLEEAAATIDDEIQELEDATGVTWELLKGEFTI